MPEGIEKVPTDPINLNFTGAEHKALADALMKAFPTGNSLDQMLTSRLEQPLAEIGNPHNLNEAAWDVVKTFKARGHVLRLVAAARAAQPDNPQLALVAERVRLATPTPPKFELEKIVKRTSVPFDIVKWRERLAAREKCVCRIEVETNFGLLNGTGFLVGPDLVLTNHHVMDPVIAGKDGRFTEAGLTASAAKVVLRFDYKALDDGMTVNPGVEVRLAEDWLIDATPPSEIDTQGLPKQGVPTLEELDHALIRLSEPVGELPIPLGKDTERDARTRGWIPLPEIEWPFKDHGALFIIQHPKGEPMKLALDLEAKMEVNANSTRVLYQTGTDSGSSGSPCFNEFWDLIALHHAGDPTHEDLYHADFNEGIPISTIVTRLKAKGLTKGLTLT
jgi:hypothetical protein